MPETASNKDEGVQVRTTIAEKKDPIVEGAKLALQEKGKSVYTAAQTNDKLPNPFVSSGLSEYTSPTLKGFDGRTSLDDINRTFNSEQLGLEAVLNTSNLKDQWKQDPSGLKQKALEQLLEMHGEEIVTVQGPDGPQKIAIKELSPEAALQEAIKKERTGRPRTQDQRNTFTMSEISAVIFMEDIENNKTIMEGVCEKALSDSLRPQGVAESIKILGSLGLLSTPEVASKVRTRIEGLKTELQAKIDSGKPYSGAYSADDIKESLTEIAKTFGKYPLAQ